MKVSYILLFFNSLGFFGESVASMEVLYANPGGGGSFGTYDYCGPKISAEIAISTTNKVHVTMYTLTSPELLRKLKDKAAAGKKVCVLVDKYQYEHCPAAAETMKSRIDNLKTSSPNAKVRVLGSDNSNDLMMHEKVAIFSNAGGNHTALLGSYNWTDSASKRHFENCVFLRVGQGVSSINASIIRLKTRFDELWRLSSSLNGGDERDLDCLFTPTPDEQKILRDAAATARSDDRAGGGNPSPGGPSSDSRSERKPMPPSKSSGEGSATPMKRVAIGPSSNPGGFSASSSC